MKIKVLCLMSALMIMATTNVAADDKYDRVDAEWQNAMVAAIDSFPEGGGYYTGRNSNAQFKRIAWRAMNETFGMLPTDAEARLDLSKSQPSFDVMATYLVMLKAIQLWDRWNAEHEVPNLAWFCFKPFCGVTDIVNNQGYNQADGEGLWGMAKANGPGIAVIAKELGVGFSFMGYRGAKTEKYREEKNERYLTDEEWIADPVWGQARKGDFMKIFWNSNDTDGSDRGAIIGDNGKVADEQEDSHTAVFMGYAENGDVIYWSSNNADDPVKGGYGLATCPRTRIQRVVFTRIIEPEKFADARKWRASKKHKWLNELGGKRHGTTKEIKKYCGID